MEVHFKPDVQAKLEQMASESGRPSDELVEDAVIGYFDELAHTREMLDRRFDDLESGIVKPIDGEEAYRRLMEKTEAQRQRRHPALVDTRSTRKRLPTSTTSANTSHRTSAAAADRVVAEIFDGIRALVSFPYQGYRRPNLTSRPLRFKQVR